MDPRQVFEDIGSKIRQMEDSLVTIQTQSISKESFKEFADGIPVFNQACNEVVHKYSEQITSDISHVESSVKAALDQNAQGLESNISEAEKALEHSISFEFQRLEAQADEELGKVRTEAVELETCIEQERREYEGKVSTLQTQLSQEKQNVERLESEVEGKKSQFEEIHASFENLPDRFSEIETVFENAVASYKLKIEELEKQVSNLKKGSGADVDDQSESSTVVQALLREVQEGHDVEIRRQKEVLQEKLQARGKKKKAQAVQEQLDEEVALIQEQGRELDGPVKERALHDSIEQLAEEHHEAIAHPLEVFDDVAVDARGLGPFQAVAALDQAARPAGSAAVTTAMTALPQDLDLYRGVQARVQVAQGQLAGHAAAMVTAEAFAGLSLAMGRFGVDFHVCVQQRLGGLRPRAQRAGAALRAAAGAAFAGPAAAVARLRDAAAAALARRGAGLARRLAGLAGAAAAALGGARAARAAAAARRAEAEELRAAVAALGRRAAELEARCELYEEHAGRLRGLGGAVDRGFARLKGCVALRGT